MRRLAAVMRSTACVVLALSLLAASATRPANPPLRKTGKTPIARAMEMLKQEAARVKSEGKLPVAGSDYASRCPEEIAESDIVEALMRRTSGDPFTDAYIRWQLTSFNPKLPDLDDRLFFRLMGNAPALLANPAADEDTLRVLERAEDAAGLSPTDATRLRETWTAVQRNAQLAQAMNKPALEWRGWIEEQLAESGPRRIQWLIERCAATITAGWPSRDIKGDLTKAFRSAGAASSAYGLTPPQRSMIAEQTNLLKGLRRRAVEDVTFMANGSIDATFANYFVDEDDVQRWIALLNGEQVK
jgi:hypothetical protein